MSTKDWRREIFTIPNLLSLFRLILIPLYISIYVHARSPEDHYLAAAILAVSCLTDMIDGKIARRFNLITTVGKVLDPLADKATQFSLIVCLSTRYPALFVIVFLFLGKELFQLIAGSIRFKHGRILKGALLSGKICTTVLFISLIAMVFFPSLPTYAVHSIVVMDAVFLTISFIEYIIAYIKRDSLFQTIDESFYQK